MRSDLLDQIGIFTVPTGWKKWTLVFVCMSSLAWLGFVLFLDMRYDMLPNTTIGGFKILFTAWAALGFLACLWYAVHVLLSRLLVRFKAR